MPNLGPPELLLILLVLVLLFGAKKLPELARGAGSSLRIFKSEVADADGVDQTAVPGRVGTGDTASTHPRPTQET